MMEGVNLALKTPRTTHSSQPPHHVVPPILVDCFWSLCALNSPLVSTLASPSSKNSWESPYHLTGRFLAHQRWSPPLQVKMFAEVSAASNIWTLACTLYELFANHPFFHMFSGDANEVLADIVALYGKLSERWWRV